MNLLSDILVKNSLVFKKLQEIDLRSISKIKSYKIYYAIDINGFYSIIIFRNAKSRFVNRNLLIFEELFNTVLSLFDLNFTKRYFFINSQICSKSRKTLEDKGFKIYDFVWN